MADKALVLAINGYESVSPLRGCENDARNMVAVLSDVFGFDSANIRQLLNEDVKKPKIRPLLSWLFQDARPGDRVSLHFSGHGSRIADTDKDEGEDELDELLCLHDMDFARPSSYLLDDELRRWTSKCPPGVHLTVFLDCCHSGSGTRMLIPEVKTKPSRAYPRLIEKATAIRAVESRVRARGRSFEALSLNEMTELARTLADVPPREQVLARFIEPPEDIAARVNRLEMTGKRKPRRPFSLVPRMNHILVAACQDFQTAADAFIDGEFNGAFSYYLTRILREAGRELDRHELLTRVASALQDNHYEQKPSLEGPALYGALFSEGRDDSNAGESPGTAPPPPEIPAPSPTPIPEPEPPPTIPTWPVLGTEQPPRPIDIPVEWAGRAREGYDVYRELLATFNRLIDLIGPAAAVSPAGARAAAKRHLVYVHGIGKHFPGFSTPWWNALAPHAPSLHPGALATSVSPPNGNRHEARWSDFVNDARSLQEETESDRAAASALANEIRAAIADRQERMLETAAILNEAEAEGAPITISSADRQRGFGIPGLEGLDDFSKYMTNPKLRAQILAVFANIVRPLIRQGFPLEIITHSWGTVVAYEGLRHLDGDSTLPSLSVRNFFTLGSALSIAPVRHNLFDRVIDGRKPRLVSRWINLDARGDLVGGGLVGHFAVDLERLRLPPVGCGLIPTLVCAHSSYFKPANLEVNANTLGRWIENP